MDTLNIGYTEVKGALTEALHVAGVAALVILSVILISIAVIRSATVNVTDIQTTPYVGTMDRTSEATETGIMTWQKDSASWKGGWLK